MRKKTKFKKIVIKVGTKTLTSKNGKLNKAKIRQLVSQITRLMKQGIKVILVSSGAIAEGMSVMGLRQRPENLPFLQAAAAIGQSRLMRIYNHYFHEKKIVAAQVLLTQADLNDRKRYLNARNTLNELLERKAVPIVNENDTVSTDEIKFGDNDKLSALVANLIGADCLIILTDVDGLYCLDEKNNMKKIDEVKEINEEIASLVYETACFISVGGMKSKLEAARTVTSAGISCIIANGNEKNIISKIITGKNPGTVFAPLRERLKEKKRWIAYGAKPRGRVKVDKGARKALCQQNRSLLAAGVVGYSGSFAYGDMVSIVDDKGKEFARGLINYSAAELDKIKGLKTGKIEEVLGHKYFDEVIHRDNLVII